MKRLVVSFFVVVIVAIPSAKASAQSEVADLSWLAGCWENVTTRNTFTEMWMPVGGGTMLGAGRTVSGGETVGTEALSLMMVDGKLVYTAKPSGQAEASFVLTEIGEDHFTVSNPEHDFPQRLIYRLVTPDSITARAEADSPAGPRGFTLNYSRRSCES